MSGSNTEAARTTRQVRWLVIAAIVIVAFFASYRYAVAQGSSAGTAAATTASSSYGAPSAANAGVTPPAGAGCCGGAAAAGPKVSKQADAAGGVQKISVDLSSGSYDPSEIVLTAGVPAEITFGQGSGCLAQVQSQDLGFFEDLTGGPKTVKIPALTPGTYSFTCGMQMVSGSIVVK